MTNTLLDPKKTKTSHKIKISKTKSGSLSKPRIQTFFDFYLKTQPKMTKKKATFYSNVEITFLTSLISQLPKNQQK